MAGVSEDVEVKVAAEAAAEFTSRYYSTWNKPNVGAELVQFYVKSNPESPLKSDITINGNIVEDPSDLVAIQQNLPTKTHYEVQSYDCHVVNPNYNVGAPDNLLEPNAAGKKMSIMVMVSGSVKYPDEEARGFMDNVLLVPNWDITSKKDIKEKKRWL
ncbi:hypothetical protein LSUE1_G008481, partial [Lachnellula suecica]